MCEIQNNESKLLDVYSVLLDVCGMYIVTISDQAHYHMNSIGEHSWRRSFLISEIGVGSTEDTTFSAE